MARLQQTGGPTISLFPMFNILLATLGVLVFIISTVSMFSILQSTVYVEIQGDDIKNTKTPMYLEWDGRQLIMYPSQDKVTIERDLWKIDNWKDTYTYIDSVLEKSQLGKALKDIRKHRDKKYVVILIRPAGFTSFLNLRAYFEKHLKLDLGYEPVMDSWRNIRIR